LFDFFFSSEIGLIIFFSIPFFLVLSLTIYLDSKREKDEEEKRKAELEERVKKLEEKLGEKERIEES
jgi:hypothetical protein